MEQSPMLAEPVFVGRKTELIELQRSLDSTLEGKGKIVFISGVAGSGKTRLTNEFLRLARKKDVLVLFGWCLSNSNVPYFPFIEAFNSYLSIDQAEGSASNLSYTTLKTASYLTEPYGPVIVGDKRATPLVWRDRAFLAVINELLFVSAAKPLLLVLEDMHWADTASLALLHYISRAIASERLMIIGTFRSEELASEEGPQPLSRTLHLMGREALFKEIKLGSLNTVNISKIAESMLGGPVDSSLVRSILDQSQGNPLFVVESFRMLAENGCFAKENEVWRVKGKIGIPYKVREVILRRLEALRPEERRVLDVAAVIGDKFNAVLIGSVLSVDSLIVLEILNKLFHTTLLLRVEDDVYAFDHALYREILYQEISKPLKMAYHGRIAEQLESKSNLEAFSVNQLAFHYVHAGNKLKGVEYSIAAGKDSIARYSAIEAIRHFTWVLQTVSSAQGNLERRREALEGLGDAFCISNAFKDAIKTYESLAEISKGSIRQRALVKAMSGAFFLGDIQRIDLLVKEAEAGDSLGRLEKARILHYKGVVATMLRGEFLEALKLCEESLGIFEEEYSLSDAAWLLFVVADFASGQGDMEKAIAYCLRSLAIYDGLGDLRSEMEACNEAGKVFFYCGLYSEAQKMFEKVSAIEQETKMGNHIMLAKAHCFLSLVYEAMGDIEGAIEENLKAIEYSSNANSTVFLAIIYSNLVKQFVRNGELSKALEYDGKLKLAFRPSLSNSHTIASFYYVFSQAILLAGQGKFKQSLGEFDNYVALFRKKFPSPILNNIPLSNLAWVLGESGEKKLSSEIKARIAKTTSENEQKFLRGNVKAYFTMPKKVFEGNTFQGRLDIVNVSRASCLIDLHTSVPSELVVVDYPSATELNERVLNLHSSVLEPFSVKTIAFSLHTEKAGQFNLISVIKYHDGLTTKTIELKSPKVFIHRSFKKIEQEVLYKAPFRETEKGIIVEKSVGEQFQFSSKVAEKIFSFLTKEFIRDYMQRRLVLEKAGWRTILEIAKHEKIPKSNLYKQKYIAIVELERRGLAEARYFPGERGRGGKILRLRVSYDKEIIKRHIDNQVRGLEK